ncbi:methylenetetrahydrofolate reductase (NADPH) [Serinibacter salmoneus]|uniref:Methylenetetrahydrofolate reductase n=1 Tax=Serinibacter salmoneus TaxID=556530 RepID=A0A2A9D2Q3_9MICO|nr:methylenetetrahydrofolate reductase (NADPH) [Serinibacter salmoneus]
MSTSDLYSASRPTVSFELYPPRTPKGEAQVWETVQRLAPVADYFSVTYGASGTTAERSEALVSRILTQTSVPVIAHLTCVGRSRSQLRGVVEAFLDLGVRDFLALRGDPPAGESEWTPAPDGFARASDLVALIREVETERFGAPPRDPVERLAAHRAGRGRVSIAVAAYPGYATPDGGFRVRQDELAALRAKQDAGADFAITQLFFDPGAYDALLAAARGAGIVLPLVPGVMPLTDPARIRRLCDMNTIPHPGELLGELAACGSPEVAERVGMEVTGAMVRRVLRRGAPGLHLYTFNQHAGVLRLLDGVLQA